MQSLARSPDGCLSKSLSRCGIFFFFYARGLPKSPSLTRVPEDVLESKVGRHTYKTHWAPIDLQTYGLASYTQHNLKRCKWPCEFSSANPDICFIPLSSVRVNKYLQIALLCFYSLNSSGESGAYSCGGWRGMGHQGHSHYHALLRRPLCGYPLLRLLSLLPGVEPALST